MINEKELIKTLKQWQSEQSGIKNIDAIIHKLEEIKANYEEYGDSEDMPWWEDEYGGSLVWQIACHPVFSDSAPCLNEVRGVEYKEKGWNDNCKECKARWLMEEYV